MKILCLIDSLGSGGAQRQLVELAKGFKEKGHEVSFLTYHEINFFKPQLDKANIQVHTIVEPNYLKRILKIRRFIRNSKANAVLAFLEGSSFMAAVAGLPWRKWKLVVGERSANPNILKSKKLRMYRWFHLLADYVVANSHANLEMVKKINPLLPKEKMKVIYNIVNVPQMETQQKKYPNKTHVVVAASYRDVKNLDGLIDAVKLLPQDYKEKLRIDWYGNRETPEYADKMNKKINDYNLSDVIVMNSATSDIFDKYLEADFVGLFSHYEGFPNTICEAMALGKPVVVTKASDIPFFIDEGENGFLCDSKDVSSIKDALIKAIESSDAERNKMGLRNKEKSMVEFDRDVIIDEYLKLLG